MNFSVKFKLRKSFSGFFVLLSVLCLTSCSIAGDVPPQPDPLSFWNNKKNKQNIITFVESIVKGNLPRSERIATFDFDGTIGVEKPIYTEVVVSASKMCELAQRNPDLKNKQPYKASCNKNWKSINASETYTNDILLDAFLNKSVTSYEEYAKNFLKNTKQPRFKKTYNSLLYVPMLQLIRYLLNNDFTVYLVSGSQTAFLRAMVQSAGLPLDSSRTIGSTISFVYQETGGHVTEFIRQDSYMTPMSDQKGKAELIMNQIGKTPIFAAGNTMGDYQMLLTSTYGSLINQSNGIKVNGFSMIINHDDPAREYKYPSKELMKEAKKHNWSIISMKNDFNTMFED